jgi:hypothetical protein
MVAHESGLSHPTITLDRWAWRIVSEDSIHPVAPLPTTIHPFPESKNLVIVLVAETAGVRQDNRVLPQPEVPSLRSHDHRPAHGRAETR